MSDIHWPRIDTIWPDYYKQLCELAISKKIPVEELLEAVRKGAMVSNADIDAIAYAVICMLGYEPEQHVMSHAAQETLEVSPTIEKLYPLHKIVIEDKWTAGQLEAFRRAWEAMKG